MQQRSAGLPLKPSGSSRRLSCERPARAVLINIKVAEETAIALARKAVAEGQTQKQIIVRALQSLGLPVDPLDLEDRSPRRRAAA